jgi:deoxyribonuclease IV
MDTWPSRRDRVLTTMCSKLINSVGYNNTFKTVLMYNILTISKYHLSMSLMIGFHVSIAGGIYESVNNALKIGCTAFQIFTRNPRGWAEKILNEGDVEIFKAQLNNSGIRPEAVAVHMPYLPNLSAPMSELHTKSVNSLASELRRSAQLGIPNLVVHLGSHMGAGPERGIERLVNSINIALDQFRSNHKKGGVTVLLENSAGHKNSVGSKLEEISMILDRLSSKYSGICIDTCHAFAAGYDLRTTDKVSTFVDKLNMTIGLNKIRLLHLNDSKKALGANADRHEHIGLGKIGNKGIAAILQNKKLNNRPIIMETPKDSVRDYKGNLVEALKLSRSD